MRIGLPTLGVNSARSGGSGGGGGSYDVAARLAAFKARNIAVNVAAGRAATSNFSSMSVATRPTITSTATVNNQAELTASAAVSGRRTIFGSSFTGSLNIPSGRTDQEYDFNGFTLTSAANTDVFGWASNVDRIHLKSNTTAVPALLGGNVNSNSGGSNMTFEKMRWQSQMTSTPSFWDDIQVTNVSSLTIVGCVFEGRNYGLWYSNNRNMIVANSIITSPTTLTPVTRGIGKNPSVTDGDLILYMDSLLQGGAGPYALFRCIKFPRAAVWNCQLNGGASTSAGVQVTHPGGGDPVELQIDTELVLDTNRAYVQNGTSFYAPYGVATSTFVRITLGTYVDNIGYSDYEGGSTLTFGEDTGPGWYLNNNPRLAYTAPPAWSIQP